MHSPASKKQLIAVVGFTAAYMIISAIVYWRMGNSEFIFYIAVMAVLIGAIALAHRKVGLSAGILWCFTAWGFLHMAGGIVPIPDSWKDPTASNVLYNWRLIPGALKYDQVVHFFGFGVTTWLCWQALSVRVKNHEGGPLYPTPGLMTLCAVGGMGFGALNEVIEFFATLSISETNVGGYLNTSWDLVSNLVGAVVAAFLIYFLTPKKV